MSAFRCPDLYALLAERLGWTRELVDELPDVTLAWLLELTADS